MDLLLLSFAAGSTDAAGYLSLGRVFTCNMTGNVVLLGFSLGERQWGDAARFFYVLLMFSLGGGWGLWITRNLDPALWPDLVRRILGLESFLLLLFAAWWAFLPPLYPAEYVYGLLGLLAPAMGLQTAALFRLKAPGMQTTAVTATIANLLSIAIEALSGSRHKSPSALPTLFIVSVLVIYCLGALVMGFVIFRWNHAVGFIPALLVLGIYLRHKIRLLPSDLKSA